MRARARQDACRERSLPESPCFIQLATTRLTGSKHGIDGRRRECGLYRADMLGEPLNAPGAKDELPAKLLGIVRLEVEKRSLKEHKTRLFLRREARQSPYRLRLREDIDVRQQFRNGCAVRDFFPEVREFVGGKRTLFFSELIADRVACSHQLIEEIESEGPEGDIGLFREVDGRTPGIEDAHARDELVVLLPRPLPRLEFRAERVLDRDDGGMWRRTRNDIAKDLLLSASPAGALEDPYVARLPRGVVAIDHGEARGEAERLVLRQGIHSPMMEYRVKRHPSARSPLVGDMFAGKRNDFLRLSEAVASLADLGKAPEILIQKLVANKQASQRVALPDRTAPVLGPVEDFMQDGHHHLLGVLRFQG